ncbi:hypothetical protein D050_0862 [Vibrio parahaemolyticus VPCR-2009]|nr:hypothetical protein D050_0862 [Vibrio parahaemolyticus VPCR-2009]
MCALKSKLFDSSSMTRPEMSTAIIPSPITQWKNIIDFEIALFVFASIFFLHVKDMVILHMSHE